jgi:hypothetical protein
MRLQITIAVLLGLAMADMHPNRDATAASKTKAASELAPNMLPYDWFANAQPRVQANPVRNIVLVQAFGTGSYICTPAGSGRNSRCFKRFN